ncbi:MAG: DMT family transporter [Solirubrobacteraceae bacterium]
MGRESTATDARRVAFPSLGWAALGVLAFSFTFPATTLAERGFDAYLVGAGRSVIAAALAAVCLRTIRAPLPTRDCWPGLVAVAIGCGIGFGLLSALALRHTNSSHAAVVVGLLPAATAIVAVIRVGDRPSWLFWAASGVGSAVVVAYAISRGAGRLHLADALLLTALIVAAGGYAEGGRLARSMPGWQVIAWGVLLALPISLPITVAALVRNPPAHPSASALGGLAYVGVVSMFVGFFAWYRGLAEAGVAKASQLQLAQPLLTIAWSAALLGDRLDATGLLTAIIITACVLITQRARFGARAQRPTDTLSATAGPDLPRAGP